MLPDTAAAVMTANARASTEAGSLTAVVLARLAGGPASAGAMLANATPQAMETRPGTMKAARQP